MKRRDFIIGATAGLLYPQLSKAQTLPFANWNKNVASTATIQRTDGDTDTGSTNYSFSSKSIGSASSDRLIVVVASLKNDNNSTTPNPTCTIAGGAATRVVLAHQVPSSWCATFAIFSRAVPTGTTATIAINNSSLNQTCCIDVYALKNLRSHAPIVVRSTVKETGTNTTSDNLTFGTRYGGVGVVGISDPSATNRTYTWTNATKDSEEFLVSAQNSSAARFTVASGAAAFTTVTVSINISTETYAFGGAFWR